MNSGQKIGAKALKGVKVVSLALNLPGPAALMRLHAMGARCVKIEPPPPGGAKTAGVSADPMWTYARQAYEDLHAGVRVLHADLKSETGQRRLQRELAHCDVLLTSFRPSALKRLGLDWPRLRRDYPELSLISIVGWPGAQAEVPGHDLTYMAENDLISELQQPPTLFADMGGALLASEAVLQAMLQRRSSGRGSRHEVALSDAAAWLALPRRWGLTDPGPRKGQGPGILSGRHAGYRLYACRDGRVAVAALEPHFAAALGQAAGLALDNARDLVADGTHEHLAGWFAGQTRAALDRLAAEHDLPLHTLPAT